MISVKLFSCGQAANIARTSLQILKFVNSVNSTHSMADLKLRLHKEKGCA